MSKKVFLDIADEAGYDCPKCIIINSTLKAIYLIQGVIIILQGRGAFVSEDYFKIRREEKIIKLRQLFKKVIMEAKYLPTRWKEKVMISKIFPFNKTLFKKDWKLIGWWSYLATLFLSFHYCCSLDRGREEEKLLIF